jgi:hypothetical protein
MHADCNAGGGRNGQIASRRLRGRAQEAARGRGRSSRRRTSSLTASQRLTGASLLVFNNKTDVADAMRANEVRKVGKSRVVSVLTETAAGTGRHHNAHMGVDGQQRDDGQGARPRHRVGAAGCEEPAVLVLMSCKPGYCASERWHRRGTDACRVAGSRARFPDREIFRNPRHNPKSRGLDAVQTRDCTQSLPSPRKVTFHRRLTLPFKTFRSPTIALCYLRLIQSTPASSVCSRAVPPPQWPPMLPSWTTCRPRTSSDASGNSSSKGTVKTASAPPIWRRTFCKVASSDASEEPVSECLSPIPRPVCFLLDRN